MSREGGMAEGFQSFDTTADTGLKVYGASLEEVFRNALRGLFSIITDLESIEENEKIEVNAEGEDWADLMVTWLNELIFLQDAKGWLFKDCYIEELKPYTIKAICKGERFKKGKHQLKTLVKAATYHKAAVEETPEGYKAVVILDV